MRPIRGAWVHRRARRATSTPSCPPAGPRHPRLDHPGRIRSSWTYPWAMFAIMGVVNVTPDSFSDGGQFDDAAQAVAHGRRLAAEGAEILDVGGESTRPGADPVAVENELARVMPVIEGLVLDARVSIDTMKLAVAQAAVGAGASYVNDVTAFRNSPEMAGFVADARVDCC